MPKGEEVRIALQPLDQVRKRWRLHSAGPICAHVRRNKWSDAGQARSANGLFMSARVNSGRWKKPRLGSSQGAAGNMGSSSQCLETFRSLRHAYLEKQDLSTAIFWADKAATLSGGIYVDLVADKCGLCREFGSMELTRIARGLLVHQVAQLPLVGRP